ncbi:MAG: hypothetical protein FGM52_15220 [Mycobacterium sp.]|nr:hypothetical protein [Mycobacterium sp.]
MLIVALVLAVVGLAALITAVVTGNELIAWVCIGASGLGVLLLIVDAIRERSRRPVLPAVPVDAEITEVIEVIEPVEEFGQEFSEEFGPEFGQEFPAEDALEDDPEYGTDYAAQSFDAAVVVEDHPDELVDDEPAGDMPSDDEAEFPQPAEEAAVHILTPTVTPTVTPIVGDADAGDRADADDRALVIEPQAGADRGDATTEIRYVSGAEGSTDTVYTYAESAEAEYLAAQDVEGADEPRDSDPRD